MNLQKQSFLPSPKNLQPLHLNVSLVFRFSLNFKELLYHKQVTKEMAEGVGLTPTCSNSLIIKG